MRYTSHFLDLIYNLMPEQWPLCKMSYYHEVAPDKTSFVRKRRCSFKTGEMFYFLSQIQSILQSCNSTGWPCHTTAVLRLCQTHILSAHTDHQHDVNPFPPAMAWQFSFSCVRFCQHPVKPLYYLVWVILSRIFNLLVYVTTTAGS